MAKMLAPKKNFLFGGVNVILTRNQQKTDFAIKRIDFLPPRVTNI
jgi:hypothetical protein